MKIIGGSGSKLLAARVAELTGLSQVDAEIKRFPDTECYVRVKEGLSGEEVVIIQTTFPDENLLELVFLQNVVRQEKPSRITTIIPYYAYARQDKIFKPGELLSAKTVAKLLQNSSDEMLILNPHKPWIADFFDKPVKILSSSSEIADYLKSRGVELVVGPDINASMFAEEIAESVGCDWDWLEKKRISSHEVILGKKEINAKGKRVAIVDDIISTGGTLTKAIEVLKSSGAREVLACCVHGLFINRAVERLKNAGCAEIISTDTVESEYSKISVAKTITEALSPKR
jgi:ribose-phosphate pyrophosphokinase